MGLEVQALKSVSENGERLLWVFVSEFVCAHLFEKGFQYVLLREIQSDRIEGEFSVYRQSIGANAFMTAGDVDSSFKKRLARFAASYLEFIDAGPTENSNSHTCKGMDFEDAINVEACLSEVDLSDLEEYSVAYVAGWLEMKCSDLVFPEDEPLISSQVINFIEEVSRGALKIPHGCTYELVSTGLRYMKKVKQNACCRNKLMSVLQTISDFFDLGFSSTHLFRRLANVLLNGLHKLEKDHQKNAGLYQTSIKKARLAD